MQITEPSTLLTDYLLAAVASILAVRLARRSEQRSGRLMAAALGLVAVAALVGGSYHGFRLLLPPAGAVVFWKTTLYAIGLADLCLIAAACHAYLAGRVRRLVILVGVAKFLVYAALMFRRDDFLFVVLDYLPSLALVLALAAPDYWVHRCASSAWMAGGVVVALVAAAVQQSGISLHRHLNHNDLYHLIQLTGIYCWYRGGLGLSDRSPAAAPRPAAARAPSGSSGTVG